MSAMYHMRIACIKEDILYRYFRTIPVSVAMTTRLESASKINHSDIDLSMNFSGTDDTRWYHGDHIHVYIRRYQRGESPRLNGLDRFQSVEFVNAVTLRDTSIRLLPSAVYMISSVFRAIIERSLF